MKLKEALEAAKNWYAHSRKHKLFIALGYHNTKEDAIRDLSKRIVGKGRLGWAYDTEKEFEKAIKAKEIYVSNSNIH